MLEDLFETSCHARRCCFFMANMTSMNIGRPDSATSVSLGLTISMNTSMNTMFNISMTKFIMPFESISDTEFT